MKRFGAWVLVLCLGWGLSGCRGSSSSDGLGSLVESSTPSGYQPGPSKASGPQSRQAAAGATSLPTDDVSHFLETHHFKAGYGRVWTSGKAFVVSEALRFATADDAKAMLPFVRGEFAQLTPTYLEDFPRIPGGLRYDFNLLQPSGIYQICTGVWFAVATVVHLVSACNDNPPDRRLVEERALAQYQRSQRMLHVTASSTGPNAGTAMSSSSTALQKGSAP
jgi:hypothetical protein